MPETKKETINYEKLYNEECKKNTVLENKCAEYEKICKSLTEKANQAQELLQKATLEYNARIDYVLDCTKHAYISIQMANNTPINGGMNNGN